MGQEGRLVGDHEPRLLRLGQERLPCQAMRLGRPDRRLALVVVHVGDAPPGAQRAGQAAEIGDPVGEMVVRVDDEDHVAPRRRQQRIVGEGEDRGDVAQAAGSQPPPQRVEDLRLHVHRVDPPGRTDGAREAEREVTGAGAHVAGDLSRTQGERPDHLVRLLPRVAAGIGEMGDVGVEVGGVAVAGMLRVLR